MADQDLIGLFCSGIAGRILLLPSQASKLFAQFALGSLQYVPLRGSEIFPAAVDIKIEH